ncbi:MAG: hypothetical protein ACOX64_05660 [Candidatus Merdivicinus sp.]|jgi:hypothetical protein
MAEIIAFAGAINAAGETGEAFDSITGLLKFTGKTGSSPLSPGRKFTPM